MIFEADLSKKQIHIVREFNAPVEKLWRALTEPELLDQWVGPKPWKAETKTMNFTVGGNWLYAMVNPDGYKLWVYAQFTAIETGNMFSSMGVYCDTDGNPALDGPKSYRTTKLSAIEGNRTALEMLITFEEEATYNLFADGGFKQGTEICNNQLDELLASNQL